MTQREQGQQLSAGLSLNTGSNAVNQVCLAFILGRGKYAQVIS